jgi:inner membrane protein
MDPVSQGALGAAFAQSIAGRRRLVAAGVLGMLGGMAPDLDVLIRSSTDPLLFLDYHRQFTHALVFIPVGALVCALALHGFVRRRLWFRETWLFCGLGYATHGLLDACTSYGTQLFWPFSDVRVAWNHVAVVDPLFTLPLLALLGIGLLLRRRGFAVLALAWAACYIGLGAMQGHRAEAAAVALAHLRGHEPARLTVKPSFGNLLVWKSIYAAEGEYHVDAIRAGRSVAVVPGERIPVLDRARDLPWLDPASRQARDLERFYRFSAGYLALDPHDASRVVDVRYSMVPNEIDALWGIVLDPHAGPHAPAGFVTNRQATPAHRAALWRLIRGDGTQSPVSQGAAKQGVLPGPG